MTNQAQIAVLESTPVPQDLLCVLPQATADAVAKTIKVSGLASQVQGAAGVTPVTNNVGQQALTLAQQNAQDLSTLSEKTLQTRVLATRQNVVAGDSIQVFGISPAMPTTEYILLVNFNGPTTHPSDYYNWRIVNGTQSTNSVSISFDNAPSSTSVTIVAMEARTVE